MHFGAPKEAQIEADWLPNGWNEELFREFIREEVATQVIVHQAKLDVSKGELLGDLSVVELNGAPSILLHLNLRFSSHLSKLFSPNVDRLDLILQLKQKNAEEGLLLYQVINVLILSLQNHLERLFQDPALDDSLPTAHLNVGPEIATIESFNDLESVFYQEPLLLERGILENDCKEGQIEKVRSEHANQLY